MAESESRPIVFHVPGRDATAPAARGGAEAVSLTTRDGFRVKHDIAIASNRDGAMERAVAIPGEDIIALEIAGGPELLLHPDTAADLLRAQQPVNPSDRAARSGDSASTGPLVVPMQLSWQGLEDFARRLFSEVPQVALTQPLSSMRCRAG